MNKSYVCSIQFCCTFCHLHCCQILFKLVFISHCYHESVRGELFSKQCISRNYSHWPTFLSLMVWVYLHSNLYSWLQNTHLFCNKVRFGHSRSSKVIQGRWFWYQWKARMRLPISPLLWLWSYLAPFPRYGHLLAKNCLIFLPLSHSAPSLPIHALWNFALIAEVNHEEIIESWGYPPVKTAELFWHDTGVWRTDGRTDGIYHS